MKKLKFNKRFAAIVLVITASAWAAQGLVATSAVAAGSGGDPTPSGAPLSATTQGKYESSLGAFLSSHPVPAQPATGSPAATESAWSDQMFEYFKTVPWDAVLGQWGCSLVSSPVVAEPVDASGQIRIATIGLGANCGSVQFRPGPMLALSPKTTTLSDPSNAAFAQSYRTATVASPQDVNDCALKAQSIMCLDSSGPTISASTQWMTTVQTTGYARLGQVGIGNPCQNGTAIAYSPTFTGGYYNVWTASATQSVDTTWSSSFWNPDRYGLHCAVI
jgi:hypothetical protein